MNEKRRDNKGRVLRNSESQRPDGKYEFKYLDAFGRRRSVYSWKLVSTDKLPPGKRACEPLRDIEKRLSRDFDDGIDAHKAYKTTLNDYYDEYIATKIELKAITRTNYQYMYKKFVSDSIGAMRLVDIKYSDIKKYYIHLIKDFGFKPNTVDNVHTLLHPVFAIAVRDGILRVNPTDGALAEIKRSHNWETPKRHALTTKQQERFVEFVSQNPIYKRWMTLFTVMLGTGARIGEVSGLRWEDCDFENNIIEINHNLVYNSRGRNGAPEAQITTPKTRAGIRIIPMFSEVKKALLEEYGRQKEDGFNPLVVDGYTHFIFFNQYGHALHGHSVNKVIDRIVKEANAQEQERARQEHREPLLLPHFSCHNLRHTFCTRLCENESNIKVIQEIMGHKNIETTMDVYSEATKEKKIETFASLEGTFRIS